MAQNGRNGHNRRAVVGMLGLALAGAASSRAVAAQRGSVPGGIAGGGVIPTASGAAEFSLFATRLPGPDGGEPVVVGHLRWVDPLWEGEGLTLVSTEVTEYGPPADDPESPLRVIRGRMSANGEGDHPFELWAFDAGPDRFGEDTAALVVGAALTTAPPAATPAAGTAAATPAAAFGYLVKETTLAGGNLELLDLAALASGGGS